MNHKPKIVVYDEFGHKVWQHKEADVEKLYRHNTPINKVNPSLRETIAKINKKLE